MNTDEMVVEILGDISGATEITPETTLESLGLDSLDVAEFHMELEEEFEILVEDEAWQQCKTVKDIAELIESRT